jgi:hypothetical protein
MIRQEQLAKIADSQKEDFLTKSSLINREDLSRLTNLESFATLITGIRRCGKSTLLQQVIQQKYPDAFFLNFEDIRLAGFDAGDFSRLYDEIKSRSMPVVFLDEPQLADKWEIFVNQLLREHFRVYITGSNATLLSREMGTHLTGRNLPFELYPFSYTEFLNLKGMERGADSLYEYLIRGGMPEYLKSGQSQVLNRLIDDILVRDIAVRQSLRDINTLRQLTVYLLSNVGNLVSATGMTGMFGLKSATTFLEYFSFLHDAYLFDFVPQFSWSQKVQSRNPKKIYASDNGFVTEVASVFTENLGARFENLVYLHLRRKFSGIYYFKDRKECDFVVVEGNQATEIVQACYKVDDLNFEREYTGLIQAMKFFNKKEGIIVTFNQKDRFEKEGLSVMMIPAHEYLTSSHQRK